VHRRDFNLAILKVSAAAWLSPRLLAQPLSNAADEAPPAIAALYKNAIVIDSLCGPLVDMDAPPSAEILRAVQQSGITAINFTISDPTFEGTVGNIAAVETLVDEHPEVFLVVRRHSDIARAKRENKIGILPGFQYTAFLEEKPERIEMFRQLGVRIMQLTYNNRSIFGDGCLEPGNAGLSKAGIAAVKKMNDLGVASTSATADTGPLLKALLNRQARAHHTCRMCRCLCSPAQQAR
jgi:membrane dipeptidase